MSAMEVRLCLLVVLAVVCWCGAEAAKKNLEEEEYGVRYATDCEVCKLVTKEVSERLQAKDSSGVIETGYNMDAKKKKTKYNKSELRLVETLEEVCRGMLDYRVHKERQDSTRWAKQMSQTFQTLHNLVNKGVKVDLGIPMELWDDPSAEVAHLKTQCEGFVEDYEDAISEWYFGEQLTSLQEDVCSQAVQKQQCLSEPYGEDVESPPPPPKDQGAKGDTARTAADREDL